jgi:precorrin-8X/cobalt-precorrin-8 methylmutase
VRQISEIEQQSYEILRSLADTSHLPALSRAVAERIIHATADFDYLDQLILREGSLIRGRQALESGTCVVCDTTMVACGITACNPISFINDKRVADKANKEAITRSQASIQVAAAEVGPGAIWVVGNAPTALFELLRLRPDPAFVVGLPVGFVGAAESKEALAASDFDCVTNVGPKGGSAAAAAATNALLYTSEEMR